MPTDHYVSKSGKDANAGTLAKPYRTIAKALTRVKAGDRVFVRAGVYQELVRLTTSGTSAAPIRILAYPGETVTIDGAATPADTDLVTITGSHATLAGFVIRNAKRSGIAVWGAQATTLARNVIRDCRRGGIWVGHDSRTQSRGHVIEDNTVYRTCLENAARNWSGGWPRAIAVDMSDDTIVRRNRVRQNYGEGVGALSSYGVRILDNHVHDNFSVNIYLDNAPWTSVLGNRLFHTGDAEFFRNGKPALSVLIANEEAAYPLPSSNITVTHNTIAGLEAPFYDGSYGLGGGLAEGVLAPNTLLAAAEVQPSWLA